MTISFVIAIDGPAASGKGTIGRQLADHFALSHLDTGLTYRAVAYNLLNNDWPLDDIERAVEIANSIDLSALNRSILSSHTIGAAASKIAAMSPVRAVLVDLQRQFANTPPGAVLDGRDIGTVVCPDAQVKLYITASARERAKRRWKEITDKGEMADFDVILRDIAERDARDMSRDDSPLKPAEDAHLIDTSEMSIEIAFQACLDIVNRSKRD